MPSGCYGSLRRDAGRSEEVGRADGLSHTRIGNNWAVAQSLSSARARCPNKVFLNSANIQLIYGPLRDFARNQHGSLVRTLEHLAVLEARFQRRYLREEEMDWTCDFDTNTEFFNRVTTTSSRPGGFEATLLKKLALV